MSTPPIGNFGVCMSACIFWYMYNYIRCCGKKMLFQISLAISFQIIFVSKTKLWIYLCSKLGNLSSSFLSYLHCVKCAKLSLLRLDVTFFFGINKNKHASLILNEHLHQKNLHDRWERVMVSSNKTIYFVSSAEKSFLNLGNSILTNELAYNYSAMASPSPELCAFPKKASKFILLSLCIHP